MWRMLGITALLVLTPAGPASGQDPAYQLPAPTATAAPTYELPTPTATAAPAPTAVPDCRRGSGTDGDYAYDDCCRREGTDADYAYVCPVDSGAPPRPVRRKRGAVQPLPAAVQPLPAGTLPVTGGEPLMIALVGLGFLLTGAGLRTRALPRG
jgi:hypothetical protein